MKRFRSPFEYAAAFVVMFMLTTPSRAALVDVAWPSTVEVTSSRLLLAQAPSTPAPAQTMPAPLPRTKPKISSDDRVEAHINKLHTELHITPAQEDLWKDVAQVMRENEKTMEELHKSRAEQAATMTAVDDLKSDAAIADAHANGL